MLGITANDFGAPPSPTSHTRFWDSEYTTRVPVPEFSGRAAGLAGSCLAGAAPDGLAAGLGACPAAFGGSAGAVAEAW